jgi:transcriptional regulator of acetoin/glycerol metabolism
MVTAFEHGSRPARDLARARDAIIEGREPQPRDVVPRPILDSWRRSAGHHVTVDRVAPPYTGEPAADSRELRATLEVVARAAHDLGGEAVSLILTDPRGRVLRRWCRDRVLATRLDRVALAPGFVYSESGVGTNGIGTALARRSVTLVDGAEHYSPGLAQFSCAGAPIVSPTTGEVIALVDLTARSGRGTHLMVPFVRTVARAVEEELRRPQLGRGLSRIEELERDAIVSALSRCAGDKEHAAAVLGLSRATVYRRIRRYGLCAE